MLEVNQYRPVRTPKKESGEIESVAGSRRAGEVGHEERELGRGERARCIAYESVSRAAYDKASLTPAEVLSAPSSDPIS